MTIHTSTRSFTPAPTTSSHALPETVQLALERVEALMSEVVDSEVTVLRDASRHILSAGGNVPQLFPSISARIRRLEQLGIALTRERAHFKDCDCPLFTPLRLVPFPSKGYVPARCPNQAYP